METKNPNIWYIQINKYVYFYFILFLLKLYSFIILYYLFYFILFHWIFKCDTLSSFRWSSLNFIDDLYVLFSRKIRAFNPLSSYDSISDFEDYINHYIYLFLLGGTLVLNELHFDRGEQRQLMNYFSKSSSESPVPKIVGLAEFLTRAIPIMSSSFELLFDRYSKLPYLTNVIPLICRSFRLMMKWYSVESKF